MTELDVFDYEILEPQERATVDEHTTEIRRLTRRAAEDIVEIGQRLIEVKAIVGRGNFLAWVDKEFGWSYEAAKKFMQVARQFESVKFTDLKIAPSALYALASGSTPEHIRVEVLEMARATELPVTNKAVQERLKAHRQDLPAPAPAQAQDDAPPAAVDNAGMPPKKKEDKPVKAAAPYVPLPVEYEEREHEDGTRHLYPKLPDTQRQVEIKGKDWEPATRRVNNASSAAHNALGQLLIYDLSELQDVADSPPGLASGVSMSLKLLRDRMNELLEKWEPVQAHPKTLDAEPLLEVLPLEKEKDKSLGMN